MCVLFKIFAGLGLQKGSIGIAHYNIFKNLIQILHDARNFCKSGTPLVFTTDLTFLLFHKELPEGQVHSFELYISCSLFDTLIDYKCLFTECLCTRYKDIYPVFFIKSVYELYAIRWYRYTAHIVCLTVFIALSFVPSSTWAVLTHPAA